MTSDVIHVHYGYNSWATERILAAAERLSPEQLGSPGHAGHGSMRETLIHMIETQWGWFSWFDGSLPVEKAYGLTIDRAEVPDIPSIRRKWNEVNEQAARLVERLGEDDLNAEWPLGMPGGPMIPAPLWQLMLHVANHGTQHRSEVAAKLTEHGHSPGNMDLLYYVMERQASAS